MIQINLLKGLLKEHDDSLEDYAKVIGRSLTTVQERFKKGNFVRHEMLATKIHYNLSNERFMEIFFNEK